jgi:hypothetical protein
MLRNAHVWYEAVVSTNHAVDPRPRQGSFLQQRATIVDNTTGEAWDAVYDSSVCPVN